MTGRWVRLAVAVVACSLCIGAADITLVKHARRVKPPPSGEYVVQPGDTLSSILVKVYHARQADLPALYRQFRMLNPSIQDLNNIQAGAKIRIPLRDLDGQGRKPNGMEVKRVAPDEYVIKQGEHLAKILRDIYGIPDEVVFRQYLDLIRQLNPEITNPDYVRAGQKLRLPDVRQVLGAAKKSLPPTAPPVSASTTGVQPRAAPPFLARTEPSSPEVVSAGTPAQGSKPSGGTAGASSPAGPAAKSADMKTVKDTVLPALKAMGGSQKDSGLYFMPVAGGSSLSIDTTEIPVMELDTGKKIIFDVKGAITPEMKGFIEKAFPAFTVVSGSQGGLEELMDKALSVSGYFSINKDPSPLLVGSEEKLRFFGKWIVYKDFSRRNVFVINLLDDDEVKTPKAIRRYAGNFGIDLIEIGGKEAGGHKSRSASLPSLKRSYPALLKTLRVPHEVNREIELMKSGPVRIAYKAPILAGKVILTEVMPEPEMAGLLRQQTYEIIQTQEKPVDEVLEILGQDFEGPPVKITVAQGRTELEVPGLRFSDTIILLHPVDREIQDYLLAQGMRIIAW
jgi:hypothetical protein